jgi:curved DNA-binding protein CbpA
MAEKVPRLIAGVDIRSLKLDATDGFLLTRIDGRLGVKDLSRETGLPDFSIQRTIEKLTKLGVVEVVDPNAPVSPAAPPPPADKKPALPQFVDFAGPRYDPKELDEECDLPREERKKILDVYYRLDDLDHYTLLGISGDADKKGVKRAYMGLAAVMHPDKYFKKNLGTFKPKMETLFNKITEAHDTLTDVAKRQEYDAYLAEVATTRGMEAMFERALEEAKHVPPAAAAAAPGAAPHPANADGGSGVYAAPQSAPPAPAGPLGTADEALKARRAVLAQRLLGGQSVRPPTQSQPNPKPPEPSPLRYSNPADAMDALKRRYEQRVENATVAQAKKYVQAGDDAMAKKDVVAAASAYSIATKFAPDDAAIAMRYQEIKNDADKILCESYAKQAAYEERQQHWLEAARSWQKVAKIKVTDAKAHDRAAHCMLQYDEADIQVAAEHAKLAVQHAPQVVEYHATLAEIYFKAGMKTSAKRAAETGLKLDPKNVALLGVLKKAGK